MANKSKIDIVIEAVSYLTEEVNEMKDVKQDKKF